MKTESPSGYSSLYQWLRISRVAVPLTASMGVIIFEAVEHGTPLHPVGWTLVIDILLFAVIGPALMYFMFTWLLHRVGERDEAQARLVLASAHERQLLAQIERSVRAERLGLVSTLQGIVTALCEEAMMTGGAIYLRHETERSLLRPTVSWPSPESGRLLAGVAQHAASGGLSAQVERGTLAEIASIAPDQRVHAVPITDRGETLGVLVLSGPCSVSPPDAGVLGALASTIALLVRNNQLYMRLESQAVIEERNEMAREVHDGIAQSLGFLNFKVQQVKRLLERGSLDEATAALDELCEGIRESYDEVRILIRNLRSPDSLAEGLAPNLRRYSAMVARRTGMEIKVDAATEPDLPAETAAQLFRIAQEAISNAHKHGDAQHVLVRLDEGPDCVTLSVEDDGIGVPGPSPDADHHGQSSDSSTSWSSPAEHLGLRIMSERVQAIGGVVQIESRPDNGTIVRVRVPADCAVAAGERVP